MDHRYSKQGFDKYSDARSSGSYGYGGRDTQPRSGSNYNYEESQSREKSPWDGAQQRQGGYYNDRREDNRYSATYGDQPRSYGRGTYNERSDSRYSPSSYSDGPTRGAESDYRRDRYDYSESRDDSQERYSSGQRYAEGGRDGGARDTYGREKYPSNAKTDYAYGNSPSSQRHSEEDHGYGESRRSSRDDRYGSSAGSRGGLGRDAYNRYDSRPRTEYGDNGHDRRDDYRPQNGSNYDRYQKNDVNERSERGDRERTDDRSWRKEPKDEHIVYESELLGDDPAAGDYTGLPTGPTAEEKQKESGFGRFRGRGARARGAARGGPRGRGSFRGGRGGKSTPEAEHKEILKPYRKSIAVPDVCVPFVIGKDRHHLNALEEKLRFDAEFEVSRPDRDGQSKGQPSVVEIFAISEDVLRRVENMLHLRITEGLTSRQPGNYFTAVDVSTSMAQFTRYIGEEYNKSDKSYILDSVYDAPSEQATSESSGVQLPKDTRPWKPPPSNKRLPYDVGVAGVGNTSYVCLHKHPQQCFRLIREQMVANVRSSFKVFARLGKMIFDSKSPDFPRSGQYIRPDDVGKVLTKDLARVRFITTIPYAPIVRLHDGYIKQKGYRLTSISRKIAVHYFNGVDRLIAAFHVPSPTTSAFSSDTVTPRLQYETPILSKVKIENHRLLMTNYSRDASHIDYRLSAISAIAQSSEEHDDIIHVIASAWAMKKPSEVNEEMTLQLPLAYRNLNLHIVRYKTNETYVSEEDGATIKLTKLLQDEVSNGQWLSVSNFKKFQAQQTTAKELDCPLCNAIFRDPCTVPCCGESYCRECMQDKKVCPSCQQPSSPERLVPNKKLDKLVQEFKKLTGLSSTEEVPASAQLVAPPIAKSKWEVTIRLHKWQDELRERRWDDVDCLQDVPGFMNMVKEIADTCGNPFK